MGKKPVGMNWKNVNSVDDTCRRRKKRLNPSVSDAQRRLEEIAVGVVNYLRLSGERIGGCSYGSERIYTVPENLAELHALFCRLHLQEYGVPLLFTQPDIARAYYEARKRNYEHLRDGVPIPRGDKELPLFGEIRQDTPIATVYAYWGRNQNADRRLVKIGYTGDELGAYLHRLQRMYDPRLLASKPGSESDERAEKARWHRHLAEGREWFWPVPELFEALKREWRITQEFNSIANEALGEWKAKTIR